jgi:hypothetical protein
MTMPDERYRSLVRAGEFLTELCDAKKTPGVPLSVRQNARAVLRHFPDADSIRRLSEVNPEILLAPAEPI